MSSIGLDSSRNMVTLENGSSKDLNESELHIAIKKGMKDEVKKLLEENLQEIQNSHGLYPIHYATIKGDSDILSILLEKNVNINVKDENNWTPLHYVAFYGHTDITELLLKYKPAIDELDSFKRTPLHIACKQGHVPIITKLLSNGAQFTIKDNTSKTATQHLTMTDMKLFTIDPNPNTTAHKDLCDHMRKLFMNSQYSDIKFSAKLSGESGDQKSIPAHKNIIFARVPKLLEDLKDDNEKNQPVPLQSFTYDLLHSFLEFVYCGTVTFENGEIDLDFTFNLAKKATELSFPSLSQFSENIILSNLDESTVVSVLEYAEKYGCCQHVEAYCRYFIVKYLDKLLSLDDPSEISHKTITSAIQKLPVKTVEAQPVSIDRPPGGSIFDVNIPSIFNRELLTSSSSAIFSRPTTPRQTNDILQGDVLEKVTKLHEDIMNTNEGSIFNVPVDHVGLGIPDYPFVIKNPMDFGLIKENLLGMKYKYVKNYSSDVRLVFDNARVYNTPDSSVHISAVQLSGSFESMYRQLKTSIGLGTEYDKLIPKSDTYYEEEYKKGLKDYTNHLSKPTSKKRKSRGSDYSKPLSVTEIESLGEKLSELDEDQVQKVIEILNIQPNEDGECEIVITDLDQPTLQKLKKFVYENEGKVKKSRLE